MTIKNCIRSLNPKELFIRISYRILKSKLPQMRIIRKFVNSLLLVWHVINLAHTRADLMRMTHKKKAFSYEDYPSYM